MNTPNPHREPADPRQPVHPAPGDAQQLRAEGIVKRFGTVDVLKGVSLQARRGDVISMIGASGSGKSTFLRCLNLLELPSQGCISLGDEALRLVPQD